jgi:hypothetical protein
MRGHDDQSIAVEFVRHSRVLVAGIHNPYPLGLSSMDAR